MIKKIRFLLTLIMYRIHIFGKKVILIDTPEHDNLGDQAIALAEEKFLHDHGLSFWELSASQLEGREKWYAKFTPSNKKILVQGGGFLGSLWINEEYRFRRIILAFAEHKIIVFPQTIFFDNNKIFLEESREIYNGHSNLTIFAREEQSYKLLCNLFTNVHTLLIPDMVLYLNPGIKRLERKGFLICLREDEEKNIAAADKEKIINILKSFKEEHLDFIDTLCQHSVSKNSRENIVLSKLSEFSHEKLVVTDRLHGMIFSAISGTPCIAFSNINGKVGGVYQWLKNLEYIYFVENIEEFENTLPLLDLNGTYVYNNEIYLDDYKKVKEIICQ